MNNDVTPKPLFGDADSVTKTRHTSGIFHSIEGTSTVIIELFLVIIYFLL